MPTRQLPAPRLRAVTREIEAVDELLEYAAPADPLVWSRRGDTLVGTSAVLEYEGPPDDAAQWWQRVADAGEVDDPLGIPGTGLIAFGALPFDPASAAQARLTVPAVVLGHRGGRTWITRISPIDQPEQPGPGQPGPETPGRPEVESPVEPAPYGPHWSPTVGPGALTPEGYQAAVRAGLAAIAGGEVSKVVLARDLVGSIPPGSDLRRLVRALTVAYPDTWVYAVDGLIGASPETLLTVSGGTVTARVLAGTIARGVDADADTAASVALATSAKDLDEHQYAVQSVLTSLRPHTSALVTEEQPFMLKLPNVWHLATDVEGTLQGGASALDLVHVLHPTAAVAGTPTDAAMDLIRRLEPFDRGRYAGPVGWINAHGDGEWAIALRCAQFELGAATDDGGIPFTAHAGAGIVAGSDPEAEMLETRLKFRPIVDSLA
ncbi:isochorismate synthase [Microbacterium invictum]|uniref:isochorismate synthase n=1 Tax=Microbacterium invictum TaxID=515415 RepID=A0AA40SLB9_9MICO|nr:MULTISPECIES: isochorismate synthase [Microbacterium]MBB4138292.1 menaquinone-specific isochorismate synthase [Microbacterium invictum]